MERLKKKNTKNKKQHNSVVVSLETGLHCFFSGIFTFGSIVNLHYIGVGKSLTETYIFIAPKKFLNTLPGNSRMRVSYSRESHSKFSLGQTVFWHYVNYFDRIVEKSRKGGRS